MWRGVPAAEVHGEFDWLRGQLQRLELYDITIGQIEYHLREADLQLWIYGDRQFALITEIVKRPNATILLLRWGVGKLSKQLIADGRLVVIPWAKSYGCEKVEVAGRAGWHRLFNLRPLVTIYRGDL